MTESTSKPRSWTSLLLGALRTFVLGVFRLGVVLLVYVIAAVAGALVAALTATGIDTPVLLATVAGFILPLVSLTVGFVAWLLPATVRVYARGGDPETDLVIPSRLDAVVFFTVTFSISYAAAGWLGASSLGLGVLCAGAALAIVAVGGRKVAELWGSIVMEILAGG